MTQSFPIDINIKPREVLVSCIFLILLILTLLGLWNCHVSPPSGGDKVAVLMNIKNLQEGGWIYTNPKIAWPAGSNTFFFPHNNAIMLGVMWLTSQIIEDPLRVFGLIRGFLLCVNALAAWYVLRKLGVLPLLALLGAIAFATCDFVVGRVSNHTFLADLLAIPFATLACARLLNYVTLRWFDYLFILATIPLASFYYTFFSCLVILTIAVAHLVATGKLTSTIPSFLLLSGIISVSLIYLSPNLVFLWQNELEPPTRSPIGQVRHGLRFIDSMVPPLPIFSDMFSEYNSIRPRSEGREFIGFYSLIGILISVLILLARVVKPPNTIGATTNNFVGFLGAVTLLTFVFALPFGAGLFFNLQVIPLFRAQNRFSVFIVFWGIVALTLILQQINLKKLWRFVIVYGLLIGLLAFEIYQGNKFLRFTKTSSKPALLARVDKIYNELNEANVLYILQLPIHPYPEGGPKHKRRDYFHGVPYVISKGKSTISWSYGMSKHQDLLHSLKKLEELLKIYEEESESINDVLLTFSCLGYQGLYIDRLAYKDNAAQIEKLLSSLTLEKIYDDGEWVVYKLPQHTSQGKIQNKESISLCLEDTDYLKLKPNQNYSFGAVNLEKSGLGALASGWGNVEKKGVWSNSSNSIIKFNISDLPKSFKLVFSARGLTAPSQPIQNVDVIINEELVEHWTFTQQNSTQANTLRFDRDSLGGKLLTINFKIKNTKSPKELGLNNDSRPLGLALFSVKTIVE